jgi:hypothetical protein
LSEATNTPLSDRADILAELWVQYKSDPDFADFVEYNDLGLPLAYAVSHGIVEMNSQIAMFVNETFDVFLVALDIEEDTGFSVLADIFDSRNDQ